MGTCNKNMGNQNKNGNCHRFCGHDWRIFVFSIQSSCISGKRGVQYSIERERSIPMEKKFAAAWAENRAKAEALGIKMRPVAEEEAMKTAKRALSGNRLSDGFNQLQAKGQLKLSLEALVVDKRFTQLFTDEEANEAHMRLLEVGYSFK